MLAFALPAGVRAGAVARAASSPNPIQLENAKPGTTAWNLPGATPTSLPHPSTKIEGYASESSAPPGGSLHLHISTTPAAPYRIEVFRLGWYHGLGGRRVACLPSCAGSEAGIQQPVPSPDPNTGLLDAGWPVTDVLGVATDWTSGYFIAKLILTGGPARGQASLIPFIVRAAPGTNSAMLVQASVNTWQAYNGWGGRSLYTFNSHGPVLPASHTVAAAMVSFNRPYDNATTLFQWEYDRVRFLERQGYDVSYQTDVDTDLDPGSLLTHRLDIVSGHDEYWSPTMRDAYEAARGAGINLAFLGADIGNWQMRYASADRTIVEYRSATLDPDPNPSQKTVHFAAAPVNRPECQLLGVGYPGGATKPQDPARSYTVTGAALTNPWFQATGLVPGATLYDTVGYEWDNVAPGCAPAPVQVLFHFAGLSGVAGSPASADAVTYTAASGATVVSDGSLQVAWALDDNGQTPHADIRVQRLFANIFDSLGATPSAASPSGVPVPLQPAAAGLSRSPVKFVWSVPPSGLTGYQLVVDGAVAGSIPAGACPNGSCSASVALGAGRHTWMVVGSDALGNSVTGPTSQLVVDNIPPTAFSLLGPRPGAIVWTPLPALRWAPAHDASSGVAGYELVLDRRAAIFTTRLAAHPAAALPDGRHTWRVLAVDRVGNVRSSVVRSFIVRSLRIVRRSRAFRLAHGLELAVFCQSRCTIATRVGLLGTAVHLSARRTGRAGINTLFVAVRGALRRTLGERRAHPVLVVVVTTRVGRQVRSVRLRVRW